MTPHQTPEQIADKLEELAKRWPEATMLREAAALIRRPSIRPDGEMGCRCQGCGGAYRVDITVPDELWNRIKPEGKHEGAGLLCGHCIVSRVEAIGEFSALTAALAAMPGGVDEEVLAALKHAEKFISNGIELGFIRMPDAGTPDPAHDALPKVRAAIAKAEASRLTPSAIGAELGRAHDFYQSQVSEMREMREWNFDIGSAPVDEPILAAIEFHSSGQPVTERFVCRINSHGEMVTERGESIGWDFTDVAYAWMPLPNATPPTAQEGK